MLFQVRRKNRLYIEVIGVAQLGEHMQICRGSQVRILSLLLSLFEFNKKGGNEDEEF